MSNETQRTSRKSALDRAQRLDPVCDRFEAGWLTRPRIEDFLAEVAEVDRPPLLRELLWLELDYRGRGGEGPTAEEYKRRLPSYAAIIDEVFAVALSRARQGSETLRFRRANEAESIHETDWPTLPGYEILAEVGRGGMGVVFKARDVTLGRLVAVKVLRAALANPQQRVRFRSEAEATARLQHPHLVTIHHVGEINDGDESRPYLILEYVSGGSLSAEIARSPLPSRRAAELVVTLAEAMQYAHQSGIIHRDLKPANVLLLGDAALTPIITDFGLARRLDDTSGLTLTGEVMGTPSYMAPEQASGRVKDVGPQSDLYALGAVLYESLTGRPPFRAASLLETLRQVETQEPVPPRALQPSLPRDLELICLTCLEKDPARRYVDCRQLANELQRFLRGEPLAHTRPVSRVEKTWRWCRRNPLLAALLSAAALLLTTALTVSLAYAAASNRFGREQAQSAKQLARALNESKDNEASAVANRERAERLSVGLILDRGLERCRKGKIAAGLLTLAEGLEIAERSGAPDDMKRTLRANLSAWRSRCRPLLLSLHHQAGYFTGATRPTNLGTAALLLSTDGKRLFVCRANVGQVHDAETGECIGQPVEHTDAIFTAAFAGSRGERLATGSGDGTARVWDTATGRPITPPLRHEGPVYSIAFSPDGTFLLTAGAGIIRRWNTVTGESLGDSLKHNAEVVVVSPDGRRALSGGPAVAGGRLWNLTTGQPIGNPLGPNKDSLVVAFSPDGKTALTAWMGVQLSDTETGRPLAFQKHSGSIWSAVFSPDGKKVLSACLGGSVAIWPLDNKGPARLPQWDRPPKGIGACDFRTDGMQYVLGCTDGRAQVFDAVTHKPVGPSLEHDGPVLVARFSRDGHRLLTLDNQSTARLWEADLPERSLRPHPGPFPPLPNHPTRTVHFVEGNGAQVREGGKPLGAVVRHRSRIVSAAVSLDGTRLATASLDSSAGLWEAETGRPIARLQHGHFVNAVAFSPDGRRLVTTSSDGTARLWDAFSGEAVGAALEVGGVAASPFGGDPVPLARFSEDSTLAITVGLRGVELWDVDTARPVGPPLSGVARNLPALTREGLLWPDKEGKAVCLPVTASPLLGDAERLKVWAETITGLRLGADGEPRLLNADQWAQAQQRLRVLGGVP